MHSVWGGSQAGGASTVKGAGGNKGSGRQKGRESQRRDSEAVWKQAEAAILALSGISAKSH